MYIIRNNIASRTGIRRYQLIPPPNTSIAPKSTSFFWLFVIEVSNKIIALLALMIIGVIYPDLVSVVASWVGVGRGTDLLLYILFVVFLFYVLGQYVRSQDDRDKTVRLARKVAILDAKNKYGVK